MTLIRIYKFEEELYNNDLIVFILIRKILSGSKRALNKVHKELDSRKRIRFLFCWLNYDIFEFILIYTRKMLRQIRIYHQADMLKWNH